VALKSSARAFDFTQSETTFGWDLPVVTADPMAKEGGKIPRPGYSLAPGIAGFDWSHDKLLYMLSTFSTEFEVDPSNPIVSLDQVMTASPPPPISKLKLIELLNPMSSRVRTAPNFLAA
jgi:hypothetical protein